MACEVESRILPASPILMAPLANNQYRLDRLVLPRLFTSCMNSSNRNLCHMGLGELSGCHWTPKDSAGPMPYALNRLNRWRLDDWLEPGPI